MPQTQRFLSLALALLLLGVALGALLRLGQVVDLALPIGPATHAHSHTLYWGWAGLALFTLFFERVALFGRGARLVLTALALQALVAFFVLFRFGYETPGVVISAVTLGPFLAAVVMFLRAARGRREADLPFLRAASVYVLLAYASALSRVALKVLKVEDPVWGALAVHLFLGTFGAFFVLGLMGLTVRALGATPGPLLGLCLGLAAPLLALPSMLVVPGLAAHGALVDVARLAAFVMLVPAFAWLRWVWRATVARVDRWLWRSTAAAWASGVLLFAFVAAGAFEALLLNRHAVVLVVHLQTLGVVTSSLFLFLAQRIPGSSVRTLWAHQLGVAVLLVGLGLAAIAPGPLPLALAALGGVLVVAAQGWMAARFGFMGTEVSAPVLPLSREAS